MPNHEPANQQERIDQLLREAGRQDVIDWRHNGTETEDQITRRLRQRPDPLTKPYLCTPTDPCGHCDLCIDPDWGEDEIDDDYFVDPELDQFLDTQDPDYDWLVEGLIERQDRVIVTGEEGRGKSTLLRQLGVQLACGTHPFTHTELEPLQVLLVDCENSQRQVRRKLRPLRLAATGYEPGRLRLRILGHALELAHPEIQDDLAVRIETQQVDVLIIGPLYKLLHDDPNKELPARAVADALDRLRQIRGTALILEAHSPYAENARTKRVIRPYGASLWSRWPEFGIHLGDTGELTHWRGQREERQWPAKLHWDQPWPWGVDTDTKQTKEWDGPTDCADAIVTLLEELKDELSTRKLADELRARNKSYRDDTIRAAARLAHNDGRLQHRIGSRGADLYRPNPKDILDEMF